MIEIENTFTEAWIIKYFQPEDASWNAFIVEDFKMISPAVKYLMELGWGPIVETVWLGKMHFLKDGGTSGG